MAVARAGHAKQLLPAGLAQQSKWCFSTPPASLESKPINAWGRFSL
jgi:hypothetical protein